MKSARLPAIVLLALAVVFSISMTAQTVSAPAPGEPSAKSVSGDEALHGFNAYASLSGFVSSSGSLWKLDSTIGYDFNRNFGMFVGLPLYFSNSFGATSTNSQLMGAGDAYVGAEVYAFPKLLQYSTTMTLGIPTGNVAKGFSPGVVSADWTNRFQRSFGRITPSISVGLSNTAGVAIGAMPSSGLADRGLTLRGAFAYFEEGAEFDVTSRAYVGAEGYHILPFSSAAGANAPSQASIVAEHGVDSWVGFLPNSVMSTEIGYSRSVSFALNSVSFRLGLNVGQLLHRRGSLR